jgi:phage protein D
MAGKYLAPAFKVSVDGSDLPLDLSLQVTDVSVTLMSDGTDSCSLTLANPYPDLPWTHGKNKDLFKHGDGLKVQMGYVDKLKLLFDGEVTAIAVSFPEGGNAAMTVKGSTRLHRLQGSTGPFDYANVTDEEIVKKVAGRAGLSTKVDATDITYPMVKQGPESDLTFLRGRAKRLRRELFVVGKTLNFVKSRDAESEAYTLVWGRTSEAFSPPGQFVPLKSFSPEMDAEAQVGQVIVRGYDGVAQVEIEGKAGKGQEDTTMGSETGGAVAAKAFGSGRQIVITDVPVSTKAEADELAQAIYNDRAMSFTRGTGSSVGLPDILPGKVVKIDGVGAVFSGDYYVTQATHRMGSSGYSTDFSVRRNASGT